MSSFNLAIPSILAVPAFVADHVNVLLGAAIIVAGVLVGFKDMLRLSVARAWAISSVSFAESIRRRVLLITPVAILGVIVVAQLQHPVDAQDAIRQTIKVALFATGMVVVITTIIMACTNLPKEIESRVIFTVVTKPTTRLEIVIGKILGFAKVSALLLGIMGAFTWGYVQLRAWSYQHEIAALLAANKVEEGSKLTLQHYASAGLLGAKEYASAADMQVLAKVPGVGAADTGERWVYGSAEQDVVIPFDVQPSEFIGPGFEAINTEQGAVLVANIDYEQRDLTAEELKASGDEGGETGGVETTNQGPLAPGVMAERENKRPAPKATIQFMDRNKNNLVSSQLVNGGKPVVFPPKGQPLEVRVSGEALPVLARAGRFYVQIVGTSPGTEYGFKMAGRGDVDSPVTLLIPGHAPGEQTVIKPTWDTEGMAPQFRGRLGLDGQQLRGGEKGKVPAAVYGFRGARVNPRADGTVGMEFTTGIEKSGDEPSDTDVLTQVDLSVTDVQTGKTMGPIRVQPESNKTNFLSVPAAWLGSGDFDVVMRNLTPGHWTGVHSDSIQLVVADQPFAFNLLKSLFILWLLSMLVITISIFCSTFLSWPIAIVLTLVILLGKWGVDQLGDSTGSGIGNQVATDLGFRNAAEAKVVSSSVEALSRFLNTVSSVLPDIGAFGGTDSVERGVSIPERDVYAALVVLVAFGVPLMLLSYVFLKNKEVAP